MDVIGHGIDLVACSRIERIWQDHGETFLQRIFTRAERAYCLQHRTPVVRLSGRFAAKEAVFKALGTGWRGGLEWTDVETLADPLGKPIVRLARQTAELAARLEIGVMLMSISHTAEYAVASALALRGDPRV
jgi:holo-[acyl-carrier protein] synthase